MAAPAHAWMPTAAFTDRRLGARDLRVLGVLYAHADVNRTCWPAVATLAQLTGIDRRDVQRTLRRLEGFGWLTIEAGGGRSATSRYRLWQVTQTAGESTAGESPQRAGNIPAETQEKAGESPQKGGCFTPETAGEMPTRTYQEQSRNREPLSCASSEIELNASAEPQAKSGKAAQEESFAVFWSAYPKRRGKSDARKAWQRLAPDDALVEHIVQAVEMARASPDWRKEGGQFIPYPATWLRRRGWEDELETDIEPLAATARRTRYSEAQRIGGTLEALDSLFAGGHEYAEHDVPARHGISSGRVWH